MKHRKKIRFGKLGFTFIGIAVLIIMLTACSGETSGQLSRQSDMSEQISIPLDLAESYFDEVKKICDTDNGNLWRKNLYSPMLIIDQETLDVIANESDNEGKLVKYGNVYIGKFPEDGIVANSTTNFGGKDWSMVIWPLPEDDMECNTLLCHEMFHHQQKLLKMTSETDGNYDNSHMDDMDARISIQLEWNALMLALKSEGAQRDEAINDALIIRTSRRNQFSSGYNENKHEIQEGLAEYTSYRLCFSSSEEMLNAVENCMAYILPQPSFVRNFGYLSGSLYGLLLDTAQPNWRQDIEYNSDLGELLRSACNIQEIGDLTEEIKIKYNYASIYSREAVIKAEKEKLITDYKYKFTESPLLTISLDNYDKSFNPNTLQPIPDLGMVYPSIKINDKWGTLSVSEGGCLITEMGVKAVVSAEVFDVKENIIMGKGWTVVLNKGYTIKADGQNYSIASLTSP